MNLCGVEQRHRAIVRLDQQTNLGTAENDSLSAGADKIGDDLAELVSGSFLDDADNQLVVDHAMDRLAFLLWRNQDV